MTTPPPYGSLRVRLWLYSKRHPITHMLEIGRILTMHLCPGIKAKVENKAQYEEYLVDLKPLREELGVNLKEDLYPDPLYSGSTEAQAS